MPPVVKRIQNPTEEEVGQLADLLTRAFEGDATVNTMLGGNLSLIDEYHRAYVRAAALEGEFYAVVDEETGAFVALSSWFGPRRSVFDSKAQRALGFNAVFVKLSDATKLWHMVKYPSVVGKLEKEYFTEEEKSNRWWLYILATDPTYQRKGYAALLMHDKLKSLDAESQTSGLVASSEQSAKFYLSVGYTELTQITLPGPTGENVTRHVFIRKPPTVSK